MLSKFECLPIDEWGIAEVCPADSADLADLVPVYADSPTLLGIVRGLLERFDGETVRGVLEELWTSDALFLESLTRLDQRAAEQRSDAPRL
jgi:hypothetical protein